MAAQDGEGDAQKKKILRQYLRDQLERHDGKEIDLSEKTRLWYATLKQADSFGEITTTEFGGIEEILNKHAEEIKREGLNIVDYGCGNGRKGILVHQQFEATGKLILIDYSPGMLGTAAENAESEDIESLLMDNVDLGIARDIFKRERGKASRFHLFLGQTIGNPRHPEDFIECIATSMRKEEYLLVEWFKTTKEHYDTPNGATFRLSYLEALGISREYVTAEDGEIDHFIDENEPGWYKSCFRVHKEFIHKETGKRLSPGDTIIATRSRRFHDKEIIDLFERENLEAILTDGENVYTPSEGSEKRYALFVKKESKVWGKEEILAQYGINIDSFSLDEIVTKVLEMTNHYYFEGTPELEKILQDNVSLIGKSTGDKITVVKLLDILLSEDIKANIGFIGGWPMLSEPTRSIAKIAECTGSSIAVVKTIDLIKKYKEKTSVPHIILQISALLTNEACNTKNSQPTMWLADVFDKDEVLGVIKGYYSHWINNSDIGPRGIPDKVLFLIDKIARTTKNYTYVQEFLGLANFYLKQIEGKGKRPHEVLTILSNLSDIIEVERDNANILGYIDLAYKFDKRMNENYQLVDKLFGGIRWSILEHTRSTGKFISLINYLGDLDGVEEIIDKIREFAEKNKTRKYRLLMSWLDSIAIDIKSTMEAYQGRKEVREVAKYMIDTAIATKELPGGQLDEYYSGRSKLFKAKCQEYLDKIQKP